MSSAMNENNIISDDELFDVAFLMENYMTREQLTFLSMISPNNFSIFGKDDKDKVKSLFTNYEKIKKDLLVKDLLIKDVLSGKIMFSDLEDYQKEQIRDHSKIKRFMNE